MFRVSAKVEMAHTYLIVEHEWWTLGALKSNTGWDETVEKTETKHQIAKRKTLSAHTRLDYIPTVAAGEGTVRGPIR